MEKKKHNEKAKERERERVTGKRNNTLKTIKQHKKKEIKIRSGRKAIRFRKTKAQKKN